jgi:hypothetical protein
MEKQLKRKRKLYKMAIHDIANSGVNAISLVLTPAIMTEFVALSANPPKRVNLQEDKRILVSPVLIPGVEIPRIDEETDELYDIVFDEETIRQAAEGFLINGYQNEGTIEHSEETNGISVIESWLKESENDKSTDFGFSDLPIGTWFVKIRVHDDELWNKIKSGEIKGLSIEGLFNHQLVENAMVKMKAHVEEIEAQKMLTELKNAIQDEIEEHNDGEILLASIKGVIKKDNRLKAGKRLELESYTDYPDAVANNAKKALDYANENGWGSCGTPVGKIRATQLAGKKPISVETIKRMRSYLLRHEVDLEASKSFSDGCGYLMYMSWGGKAGLSWASSKLKELGLIELSNEEIYGKRYKLSQEDDINYPWYRTEYTTPSGDKPTYFDLSDYQDDCGEGFIKINDKCIEIEKFKALLDLLGLNNVKLETAVSIASSYTGDFGGNKGASEADLLKKRNKDGKIMEMESVVSPMFNKPYKYPSAQEQTDATKRFKSF